MPAKTSFEHLLAPGRIGPVEIRNRIFLSAMGTNLAEPDGHAGERIQRHYEERARGGAGMVIAGVGAIAYPPAPASRASSRFRATRSCRACARSTDRVHAHGAKVAIQLQHAGKVATQDTAAGRPLWVPSAVAGKRGDLMNDLAPHEVAAIAAPFTRPGAKLGFHEMTREDITTLVGWFCRRRRPRAPRRLRRRRDPRRPRLPAVFIPLAGVERAHRRVRRSGREPRAAALRRDPRGEGARGRRPRRLGAPRCSGIPRRERDHARSRAAQRRTRRSRRALTRST